MSKKRKLKKEGKYKESAGLHTGEFKKAKWTNTLNVEGKPTEVKRSWKEGPFRNRAVEWWGSTKTVYKRGKEPGYSGDLWLPKKKKTFGIGYTFDVDGKDIDITGTDTTIYKRGEDPKFKPSEKEGKKIWRKTARNKRKGKTN
tara:strand:+ start:939 stop:1367 length:429 start_codon:yes stop_codon:yes gene_type:complete